MSFAKSSSRFSLVILAVLMVLGAPQASTVRAESGGVPTNWILIAADRWDDAAQPSRVFGLEANVSVAAVAGVTGVSITIGDGTVIPLVDEGEGEWFADGDFPSLAAMQAAADGMWTVEVIGTNSSTTTFMVNAAAWVDGDFFATPTGVTPIHGSSGVACDTTMTWIDPTGGTADAISVVMLDNQEDNSVLGTMSITDTSWTPPLGMAAGFNEFDVAYIDIDDNARMGTFNVTSGAIVWSPTPFDPVGYPASTPLLIYTGDTIVGFTVVGTCTTNYLELVGFRNDDPTAPGALFVADIDLTLGGVTGVTGVNVTVGDGTILPLTDDGDGLWAETVEFPSLAAFQAASDGLWIIQVFGTNPSTTTFTLNSALFVDGDFYATPTGLFPAQGAIDVPDGVLISWNDPTGGTAEGVSVCLNRLSDGFEICDDSVLGAMFATDTDWAPTGGMECGDHDFDVFYVDFDDNARVSEMIVTSGTINWGASPFTPLGYPALTPLLILGSQAFVQFSVTVACAADGDMSGDVGIDDFLAVLAQWGADCQVELCTADSNCDSTIGIDDFLNILANWGLCP